MVIKGKARGGASALAGHLERRDTNEEVRLRELRGVTARDVRGALREMDCMGSGAASVRTLYHAAINTAPGERLTDEQKQLAVDRLEKELGFEGQPRIIVEHLKKDREHLHVVFLRIDTDRMVAIPDSHNYRKHEIVARDDIMGSFVISPMMSIIAIVSTILVLTLNLVLILQTFGLL
jgi:hypothetical protein